MATPLDILFDLGDACRSNHLKHLLPCFTKTSFHDKMEQFKTGQMERIPIWSHVWVSRKKQDQIFNAEQYPNLLEIHIENCFDESVCVVLSQESNSVRLNAADMEDFVFWFPAVNKAKPILSQEEMTLFRRGYSLWGKFDNYRFGNIRLDADLASNPVRFLLQKVGNKATRVAVDIRQLRKIHKLFVFLTAAAVSPPGKTASKGLRWNTNTFNYAVVKSLTKKAADNEKQKIFSCRGSLKSKTDAVLADSATQQQLEQLEQLVEAGAEKLPPAISRAHSSDDESAASKVSKRRRRRVWTCENETCEHSASLSPSSLSSDSDSCGSNSFVDSSDNASNFSKDDSCSENTPDDFSDDSNVVFEEAPCSSTPKKERKVLSCRRKRVSFSEEEPTVLPDPPEFAAELAEYRTSDLLRRNADKERQRRLLEPVFSESHRALVRAFLFPFSHGKLARGLAVYNPSLNLADWSGVYV